MGKEVVSMSDGFRRDQVGRAPTPQEHPGQSKCQMIREIAKSKIPIASTNFSCDARLEASFNGSFSKIDRESSQKCADSIPIDAKKGEKSEYP
ncbi:hypothetical protein TNCV_2086661 [Trichonephila clavipes]|nr:hypothetical protein TNCV_2086661 [Trichonephila clavipes]